LSNINLLFRKLTWQELRQYDPDYDQLPCSSRHPGEGKVKRKTDEDQGTWAHQLLYIQDKRQRVCRKPTTRGKTPGDEGGPTT